jgi:fatty acid desaturase
MAKSYTKQRAPEDIVEMADHSDAGAALFIFFVYYFFGYGIWALLFGGGGPLALPALILAVILFFYRYLLLEWNKSGKGDNFNYQPHGRRRRYY